VGKISVCFKNNMKHIKKNSVEKLQVFSILNSVVYVVGTETKVFNESDLSMTGFCNLNVCNINLIVRWDLTTWKT
jgi:hypothetical protein